MNVRSAAKLLPFFWWFLSGCVLSSFFFKHWHYINLPLSFFGWGISINLKPYQLTTPQVVSWYELKLFKKGAKYIHFLIIFADCLPKACAMKLAQKEFRKWMWLLKKSRKTSKSISTPPSLQWSWPTQIHRILLSILNSLQSLKRLLSLPRSIFPFLHLLASQSYDVPGLHLTIAFMHPKSMHCIP